MDYNTENLVQQILAAKYEYEQETKNNLVNVEDLIEFLKRKSGNRPKPKSKRLRSLKGIF